MSFGIAGYPDDGEDSASLFQAADSALLAAKDHVNIFVYDPIAPDPEEIINQGQGNQTARAIQVRRDEALNKQAFLALIQAVVANNRAGGWRRVQRARAP